MDDKRIKEIADGIKNVTDACLCWMIFIAVEEQIRRQSLKQNKKKA